MSWLVERNKRFLVFKISGFLLLLLFVLACAGSEIFALERALFVDSTDEGHFYPLFEFLEKFFDQVEFKKDFPFSSEEIVFPQGFDIVFHGYQKDSLLFFQVLVPDGVQKLLSMVRPLSEKEEMLKTLQQRIMNTLNFHKSFKIIFIRSENDRFSVVARDLKSGKERTIKVDSLKPLEDLSISHDGRFLFLVHRRAGYREIWRLDLEKESFLPLSCGGYNDFSPYPLGENGRLVFLSDRNGENEIFVMEQDGALQKSFLEGAEIPKTVEKVTASSLGDKIALSYFKDGRWHIQICDVFSGVTEELDFPGNATDPVFSADGKEIIFVGERNGNFDLFSFNLVEKSLERLTFDPFFKAHPAVSPDGAWIVFSGKKVSNNWDIFLLERGSRKLYRLTSSFAMEISPLFTPVPIF
ncbi:MAG: TolB protein [Candidatus Atribacteria bacterium]|nr:TolB protein [Candidatus Atribacteria bacterium]